MDKLKKVFSPGNSKDDEVMYGSGGSAAPHKQEQAPTSSEPAKLRTDPEAEKKSHSILGQITNPGGNKYDETRYGTTATADKDLPIETSGTSQITGNVSNTGSGAPQIAPLPKSEDNNGILRQVLNPSGKNYDDQRYGATGNVVAGMDPKRPLFKQDTQSSMSVKSGVLGPYASHTDDGTTGSEPSNTQSHLGRDAALAGAGTAGAGAMASGANRDDNAGERSFPLGGGQTSSRSADPSGLAASSGTASGIEDTTPSHNYADPTTTTGVAGTGNKDTSALGYGDGREGLAGAAGAAGAGTESSMIGQSVHQHKGHGHNYDGDPCPPGDEPQVTGYPHHFTGPHATDTANRLDPHVPGEFPTESGEDPHGSRAHETALGAGAGAAGLGAYESSRPQDDVSSTTNMRGVEAPSSSATASSYPDPTTAARTGQTEPTGTESSSGHHYGRDAALAGGAGAAGLGAYEATKDRGDTAPTSNYPSSGIAGETRDTSSSVPHGTGMGTANMRDPNTQSVPSSAMTGQSDGAYDSTPRTAMTSEGEVYDPTRSQPQERDHHYGRDAALAGGAGAAGLGAYEATRDRGDTGPASKTVGPHSSNVANVVDPRVQPEPEKMKDHTTTGPYQSDTLNKADPRVQSDPTRAQQQQPQEKEHHYGRDAALAGGAGAAGLGGYESLKSRDEPTTTSGIPDRTRDTAAGTTSAPYSSGAATQRDPAYGSAPTQPQEKEHHYGRDAAIAGGAGAAGAGAYEAYDHRHEAELEKERQKKIEHMEKQHEKEAKQAEKEHEKDVKHAEKQHAHDVKEAEKAKKQHEHDLKEAEKKREHDLKAAEKDRKHHEREGQAVGNQHQGEIIEPGLSERELKEREYYPEKIPDEKEEKEKKPGLISRIFGGHHKEEKEVEEPRTSHEGDRPKGLDYKDADEARHRRNIHQLEGVGGAGAVGAAGAGAYEAEQHHHNKLHKDPPPEIQQQQQEAMQSQQPRQHYGTDGQIGDENQVSGLGGSANKAGDDGIVIEPHTGLPMNVGKYGSGHGGTDGSEPIEGYHQGGQGHNASIGTAHGHPPGEEGAVGPDWEAIRKANTPY